MNHETTLSRRGFLKQSFAAVTAGLTANRLLAQDSVAVPTVTERLSREIGTPPLSMQFHGTTADACRQWQADFGKVLRSLLGPHSPPASWQTTTVNVAEFSDHRREELVLEADGHPPLPVYLLLPRPKSAQRRAGILALHGHGNHGHHPVAGRDDLPGVAQSIPSANYDYGRQLVRKGYAVAAPCFTPFGDRLAARDKLTKGDACGDTFIRMQLLGKVLIAENLRDALWSLELLARHPEVDAARLGCVGLSYGGRMTMLTAAIEPRIRVAVVSGALNVMQERAAKQYGCGAQIIPGLLKYGDVPEISSLIAPRHCLWETGTRDSLMVQPWADEAYSRIRRAYVAFGAEDRLIRDNFDGGHSWHGTVAEPLLQKVLGE